MVIGIDCSRAFEKDRTGTENYSYAVVSKLLRLPASRKHHFVLFIRPKSIVPNWVRENRRVRVVEIKYRYLWTQVGLAVATWRQKLEVLWIPAHTLPVWRRRNLKTVVTIHGLEYQWLPEYKNLLQRWYLPLSTKYAVTKADRLIAVSKFTKKQLIEQLHTSGKKIKVVYEGVEEISESVSQLISGKRMRERYGLRKGKYILFVGTLMPRKNLPALIEAFALLHQRLRKGYSDLKIVIVGGRGWLTEEIFRAPARYGVQEAVVFAGRVEDKELSVLYQGAELYVQPSVTEGFGLPVIEAMQRKVPVVSSDGGALREVVGDAGVVVELGKGFSKRLAVVMERVLSKQKLREKIVQAGVRRTNELTWKKTAKETLKVLTDW